ncbi:LCP family protein [Trueperella sp.]|uniref:LCP family protein n=1 Tax=Trueperella sp. TaxID=2699835 RepID=UPI00373547F5
MANARSRAPHSPVHRIRPRASRSIVRVLGLLLLGFFLTAGSAVTVMYANLQGNLTQHELGEYVPEEERPTQAPPEDGSRGKPLNILVIGSDVRDGDADIDGAGAASKVVGMRSDTTMIVHISANRRRADVVSIPRDTLVEIPSCRLPDGSRTPHEYSGMFNKAFELGGQTGDVGAAAACTIRTVEELTGIYIDGFVVVDFASFQDVVNTLGGVDICLAEPVEDAAAGLQLDEGCQTLNGEQALGLARARKSLGDGSDLGRIDRQQQLVEAIVAKALSLDFVSNLPALYGIIEDLSENVETSTSLGDITQLGGLAYSLRNLDLENLTMITMPWEPAGPRVTPAPKADDVWEALINDRPLPELDPQTSGGSPIIEGSEAEVEQFRDAVGGGVLLED